ncbi:MAG: SRPBCC domain-containing protein [Pseudomonadota bacterium]
MQDESEREVVLRRELAFAPELVWMAMTELDHIDKWWGPDGFRNEHASMDFRVGGVWTYDMVGPDGTRYPNHCVFKDIVPHARLVYDQGDGERMWFETTITLEATAKGTLLTLRQLFPSREERDHVVTTYGAIEGGKQHLAKLEAYLRQQSIERKA